MPGDSRSPKFLAEIREGVKDAQYRNRQERARGNAAVLREIAEVARSVGLPDDEVQGLVRDGLRQVADELLPTDDTSAPRRVRASALRLAPDADGLGRKLPGPSARMLPKGGLDEAGSPSDTGQH